VIRAAFDFSWRRISVLWTMCAVFAMILMLLGSLMKLSDAYQVAIDSIQSNREIIQRTGEIVQFTSVVAGTISNHQTSKFEIGVIGQKESFWVTVQLYPTEDGYQTTELFINE
jgi:hypothetical protein